MSDTFTLQNKESSLPSMAKLETQLAESSKLVNDIVLKKYLHSLSDLEVIPLTDDLKQISDIRLFKITEMVYQKDEYSYNRVRAKSNRRQKQRSSYQEKQNQDDLLQDNCVSNRLYGFL